MTNNLNSVILEGKVISLENQNHFVICSKHYYLRTTEIVKVHCYLPDTRFKLPALNEIARVVGRLIEINNRVAICVEHIELKPREI